MREKGLLLLFIIVSVSFVVITKGIAAVGVPHPAFTPAPEPTATINPLLPQRLEPEIEGFPTLPSYRLGEIVNIEGYRVQAVSVEREPMRLRVLVHVQNNTPYTLSLQRSFSVLHQGGYMRLHLPSTLEKNEITPGSRFEEFLEFEGDATQKGQVLLFTPRGWSGPIVIFKLD